MRFSINHTHEGDPSLETATLPQDFRVVFILLLPDASSCDLSLKSPSDLIPNTFLPKTLQAIRLHPPSSRHPPSQCILLLKAFSFSRHLLHLIWHLFIHSTLSAQQSQETFLSFPWLLFLFTKSTKYYNNNIYGIILLSLSKDIYIRPCFESKGIIVELHTSLQHPLHLLQLIRKFSQTLYQILYYSTTLFELLHFLPHAVKTVTSYLYSQNFYPTEFLFWKVIPTKIREDQEVVLFQKYYTIVSKTFLTPFVKLPFFLLKTFLMAMNAFTLS